MSRFLASSLAFGLFCALVRASNPVFGAYTSSACDSCLDAVYESCPGYYQDRSYAICMCKGDGGTNFVSCMSYCDPGLNEPANAAATWYGYCTMFFKEMCAGGQEYMSDSRYESECSEEAIAGGGIGSDDESHDLNRTDSEPTKTTEKEANQTTTKAPSKTTASNSQTSKQSQGSSSGSDSSDSKETDKPQATNSATSMTVPVVAIVAGLASQLMHLY